MNQRIRRELAFRLYETLGAHPAVVDGTSGTRFTLWAPGARSVSVTGDFNDWTAGTHPLTPGDDGSGVWRGFAAGVTHGALYKFRIEREHASLADEADPFARACEASPAAASRVWFSRHEWSDARWVAVRPERMSLSAPWSIYELDLGSWRRDPAEPSRLLGFGELATTLPAYLAQTGFTHVALRPLTDRADDRSWGAGCGGCFAPAARFGTPDDLRALIDALHRHDIAVLLDWMPVDCAEGSFVGSNAFFWLDQFHLDGLSFVEVRSRLHMEGGHLDERAVAFLASLNDAIHAAYPGVRTIADAATPADGVLRTTGEGGLGFDLAWNTGRARDALEYVACDPIRRKHHHGRVAIDTRDATREHDILPLSHDLVGPGQGSLLGRVFGDDWQRFATLRLLYGYLWTIPGKPLLFMGGEFAQSREWQPGISLDWHLLASPGHAAIHRWVGDLNRLLREQPALCELDGEPAGFEWLAKDEAELGVLAFERRGSRARPLVVVCNFTPVVRENYRIGVSSGGLWSEVVNSDAAIYGGSGVGNFGGVGSVPIASHGRFDSIVVTLPPLAMIAMESLGPVETRRSAHDES